MIHITDELDPNSWLNNENYESPITELPETFMDFYRKGKEKLSPETQAEIEASKVIVVDESELSPGEIAFINYSFMFENNFLEGIV